MLWRYNPMKRELQFFDQANNRISCFEQAFLDVLAASCFEQAFLDVLAASCFEQAFLDVLAANGWRNCAYEVLRRLPISSQ